MKKLILAYFILGLNFLNAQNLDSLSNKIQKKATLANVREFVILSYNMIPTNPEKGLVKSFLAQKYAFQITNDSLIILSQRAIGRAYDFLSKNDSALFHYLKAVDLCLKYNDSLQLGFAYNSVANIYITMLNYDKAQQFALKSIKVFEKIKRNDLLIFPIVNSGNIYYYLKDVKKAIIYWERGIEIINNTNSNKFYLGMLYGNLGSAYSEFYQTQKSIDYHAKALETAKVNDDIYSQIQALHNIGLNLIELKKYKQANSYIRNSLRLSESIQDSAGIVSRLILLGNLKYYQNQQDSAIYYYEKGKQIAERIDFYFAMKSINIGLQKTYEANGDYKKSINYFREYVNVLDSIYNSEKHESINRLNIQYETEKKDLEIDKKNAEIELKKVESKRKNIVIYSVVLVLCIVIVFSVLLYNRFKLIKRQKAIIEVQKHEVEEKNREITESITYAKRLQDATLPPLKLVKEYLKDSFILYLPKDIVAGDFYWMENVNGEIYFAAADCTGHGVPGAMVSVVCSNALEKGC
jgi:tetratricopeptide (TPR) repeat protein